MYLDNFGGIYIVTNAQTRSISAENPNGEKGSGAMSLPDTHNPARMLGKGWKVRPCITLEPNTTITLADITGPGIIQHIWITVDPKAYRETILRFYWDDELLPSVEVPLGDFFCNGHSLRYNVTSLPITVNPSGGFNSYWPMPFLTRAKITIENLHPDKIDGFFYQISYALQEIPGDAARFHAQWHRSLTTRNQPEHVILDEVKGQGQYVGTFLAWTQMSNGWWGEGEIKFFIDEDKEYPTICGTGTEDYFGGAWGFGGQTYSTAFLGYPLYHKEPGDVPKHGLYRWHIPDPIRFAKALRVSIQALGWFPHGIFQPLTDDIASIAYWYQVEPHVPFPVFPPVSELWPR